MKQRAKQTSLHTPHHLMHVINQQSLATFNVPAAAERCDLLQLVEMYASCCCVTSRDVELRLSSIQQWSLHAS